VIFRSGKSPNHIIMKKSEARTPSDTMEYWDSIFLPNGRKNNKNKHITNHRIKTQQQEKIYPLGLPSYIHEGHFWIIGCDTQKKIQEWNSLDYLDREAALQQVNPAEAQAYYCFFHGIEPSTPNYEVLTNSIQDQIQYLCITKHTENKLMIYNKACKHGKMSIKEFTKALPKWTYFGSSAKSVIADNTLLSGNFPSRLAEWMPSENISYDHFFDSYHDS